MSIKGTPKISCTVHSMDFRHVLFLVVLFLIMISMRLPSFAQTPECQPGPALEESSEAQLEPRPDAKGEAGIEERWGIQLLPVRLTAAGNMVDFRYRIIDAEKAQPLLNRKENTTYLLDQASGARLSVPVSSLGALRATTKPIVGRNYFILFENARKVIKPGSKVTVGIGEFRAENVTVEK